MRDVWTNTRFFIAIFFAALADLAGAVVAHIDAKYAGALGDVEDV